MVLVVHHLVHPCGDSPARRLGGRRHVVERLVGFAHVLLRVAKDDGETGPLGTIDRLHDTGHALEARRKTAASELFQDLLRPGHLGLEALGSSTLESGDTHPHRDHLQWSEGRAYKGHAEALF